VLNPDFTADMSVWQGRVDEADGPLALRWHQKVLRPTAKCPPGIVLLGFACDEGVRRNKGRVGAVDGPKAIREALANFAWHQNAPVYDDGDVSCPDGNLEAAQLRLAEVVAMTISGGHWPLILGGGHETAWGTFQGIAAALPTAKVGVINIDAHLDLRNDSPGNSGTPFGQIAKRCQETGRDFNYFCLGVSKASNTLALFERAEVLGAKVISDRELAAKDFQELYAEIMSFARPLQVIHLSIDLDVLPAAAMPAVSAPASRGVSLDIIESVISLALSTGKVIAVDLVEYNPSLDPDGRAVRVAARLVWQAAMDWGNLEVKRELHPQ
jgi:formiminoglutamase